MSKNKINLPDILNEMSEVSKKILKSNWKKVRPMAELQLKSILHNLEQIAELKIKGKITEEQAKLHLKIQKESIRTILLSFEGIGIVAAEQVINESLAVIKNTANKYIGWKLL
jgi:transcription initiation factor IIE alpha subunit